MTVGGRRQPPRSIVGWLSVLCVVLSGCGDRAALRDAAGQAEDSGSYGIEWYAGSVDSAFELARAQGMPVLLYWGADWCPPCNRLKAMVFSRREFIERARLFVPVSLDGDDPVAQKLGERFDVEGYPTTIVFSPDGDEITRLSLGLDLERYLEALEAALAASRAAGAAYDAVLKGDATAADYRLLAYYSWVQDRERLVPAADRVGTYFGELCLVRARQPGDPLPASLVHEAREAVLAASLTTADPYARLDLFASSWSVLRQVGHDDATWDYFLNEAESSHAPDYVMSALAAFHENRQTADMALYWRQRAWKAAAGPVTRFGRGARYVRSLLSLAPYNSRLIEQITIRVFREMSDDPDTFFHGVTGSMERLETALYEWNSQGIRDDSLTRIRAEVLKVCALIPAGDQSTINCETFLASLDRAAAR